MSISAFTLISCGIRVGDIPGQPEPDIPDQPGKPVPPLRHLRVQRLPARVVNGRL